MLRNAHIFLFGLLFPIVAMSGCASVPKETTTSQILKEETVEVALAAPSAEIGSTARWYKAYWSGLHVGDLFVEITADDTIGEHAYRVKTFIEAQGIADWLSGFESEATGTVILEDTGSIRPVAYYTNYQTDKKMSNVRLDYGKEGGILSESNTPPESTAKRQPVPEPLKQNTFDPLTLIIAAKEQVKKTISLGETSFTLPLYDGKRRADALFTVEGQTEQGLIHLSLKEKPIAGYTDKELKRHEKRNITLNFYLDPENLLPVKAMGEANFGMTIMVLEKECPSLDFCINAGRET